MAAMRCRECKITYPWRGEFQNCPIHDIPTDQLPDAKADPDWEVKAREVALVEAEKRARKFPKVENVRIHLEHGMLWVHHAELLRAGFRPSVLAGGRFALFELSGRTFEIQGWDERTRRWWIEDLGPAPDWKPEVSA